MSAEHKDSGKTSTRGKESPTATRGMRVRRQLHLLGKPGCLVLYSLVQATVYICIGPWRPFSLRLYGNDTRTDCYAFVITTVFTWTPHVRVTFRRCYALLEHTIVNTD